MLPRSAVRIFRSRVLAPAARGGEGGTVGTVGCEPGERLALTVEPAQPGQVRVHRLDGEPVGFLPRHWPRRIAHRLKRGWRYAAVVTDPTASRGLRGRRGLPVAVFAARPGTPDEVWEAALETELAPPRAHQLLAGILALAVLLALYWLLSR